MMIRYIFCGVILMICSALNVVAQVQVVQEINPIAIYIGQQAKMSVTVTAPEGSKIEFPHFERSQYLVPGVEVLSAVGDTSSIDGKLRITRVFTLTSFDEHLYALPPLPVKVGGKEYKGNQLALKVLDVENVDTLHPNQFFPPKDVQNNPFQWSDWSTAFWLSLLMVVLCAFACYLFIRLKEWLSLLMVVLCAFACYLFIRLKENKPIIARIRIVRRLLPHQKAMGEIDKIKSERLVSSGDQKTYYTKLTDTLRRYIEERFGFNAMEMTSSEIIYRLREKSDQKMIDELTELFTTADLVKFAKYETLINENDLNLVNAVNFINETKQEGETTEERIVPKLSEDDKKSMKNRITIKTLLWIIGVTVLCLFAYIIYIIYTLF